jgi:acetamidase/formamidase
MTTHTLAASVATCHWGLFDAKYPPVLHVQSGDRVTVDTVSGGPDALPPADKFHIPPELHDIHARTPRNLPGHILTGPVWVEGAEPGDTLEVRILDVRLRQDWGYNFIRPLAGTLPAEFDTYRLINIPLDATRMVGRLPWGLDLPLHPFFGVMGVAPPAHWGRISTIVPRSHGGNLDNKELGPGSSLFLPVHVPGALFSCGDGHAAQGDGEVCTTAIETALQGTFELVVHKGGQQGRPLAYPRAETPTHHITMGMAPTLDQCMDMALRDMIALLGERGLSREDAYTLCSLAADFRVTQTVNTHRGVHGMLRKALVP